MDSIFPGIEDFLVLSPKGDVGRFEPGRGFSVFERLSDSFRDHSRELIEAYRKNPGDDDIRPAIVIPPMPSRKWQSASIVFGDSVLLRLFPSGGGGKPNELTPFMARSRERSIYQGFELLMAYENRSMPGVAFYCPVLFAHAGKVRDHPAFASVLADDVPPDTPIIDVLNFIALLSLDERRSERARDLVRLIRNISIQTARRAGSPLSISDS